MIFKCQYFSIFDSNYMISKIFQIDLNLNKYFSDATFVILLPFFYLVIFKRNIKKLFLMDDNQ